MHPADGPRLSKGIMYHVLLHRVLPVAVPCVACCAIWWWYTTRRRDGCKGRVPPPWTANAREAGASDENVPYYNCPPDSDTLLHGHSVDNDKELVGDSPEHSAMMGSRNDTANSLDNFESGCVKPFLNGCASPLKPDHIIGHAILAAELRNAQVYAHPSLNSEQNDGKNCPPDCDILPFKETSTDRNVNATLKVLQNKTSADNTELQNLPDQVDSIVCKEIETEVTERILDVQTETALPVVLENEMQVHTELNCVDEMPNVNEITVEDGSRGATDVGISMIVLECDMRLGESEVASVEAVKTNVEERAYENEHEKLKVLHELTIGTCQEAKETNELVDEATRGEIVAASVVNVEASVADIEATNRAAANVALEEVHDDQAAVRLDVQVVDASSEAAIVANVEEEKCRKDEDEVEKQVVMDRTSTEEETHRARSLVADVLSKISLDFGVNGLDTLPEAKSAEVCSAKHAAIEVATTKVVLSSPAQVKGQRQTRSISDSEESVSSGQSSIKGVVRTNGIVKDCSSDEDSRAGSDVRSDGSGDSGCATSDCPPPEGSLTSIDAPLHNVWEVEIPKAAVGRLIGKQGKFINHLKQTSGAQIYIMELPFVADYQVCHIEGTLEQVDVVLSLIKSKFPTLTLKNIANPPSLSVPISMSWLQLPLGVAVEVIVSSVVSAGHLFVQQHTHPSYHVLPALDQTMAVCYSQASIPMLPMPSEVGVICSAPMENGWYRAQVLACGSDGMVEIKYCDYGGYHSLPTSELRQIRSDFVTLPFQGVEVLLDNITPLPGEESFSTEADQALQELSNGVPLMAQVTRFDVAGLPYIHLWRLEEEEMVLINRLLVDQLLVEWTECY
uniref:A-kinase anchor protein 1, mitochondrial isoform X1 n=2 Tax=Myxine glutinosa TaxID=7769 RepID=UPI00358EEAF8